MNLKRVKRMVPIKVGERTAYEVDRDGKWLISWGTPITINSFDFSLCLFKTQKESLFKPIHWIVSSCLQANRSALKQPI